MGFRKFEKGKEGGIWSILLVAFARFNRHGKSGRCVRVCRNLAMMGTQWFALRAFYVAEKSCF